MLESMRQTMVLDSGQDTRKVVGMFALSAFGHLAFFILLMVMPTAVPSTYSLAPQAISVDLVSLPAGEPAPAAPAPAVEAPEAPPAAEPETPPPEAVSIPEPEPEPVSVAPPPPAPKVVKSLKKETKKKETVQKAAVEKPKPPAAPSRERQVSKAIESMRQKVATQEKTRPAAGAGAVSGTGSGGGGGGGAAVLSRIQNYRLEAALAVAQNWAFSRELAGADDDLVTLIQFRILPNGDISDIEIVKSSGNRYLDESAYRAVKKASPLAPHPEGLGRPYIEVGIRATPAGVR